MDYSRIPSRLISEIRQGNCVAFIGAGFSAPAVPNWDELLMGIAKSENVPADIQERIARLLNGDQRSLRGVFDREAAAQILRQTLGEEFRSVLNDAMRRPDDLGIAVVEERKRLLYGIPFQSILTTNFDHLLPGMAGNPDTYRESLRKSREPWFNLFTWQSNGSDGVNHRRFGVVKLHGDIDTIGAVDKDEIILSRSDYRELLFEDSRYSNFLRALFSTRTVLFLGFSFSDSYLNLIRSEVIALLKNKLDEPFAYAIANDLDQDEADYLVEHEGVHPIIYDSEGSDHSGFDRHLKYIHDETAPGKILGRLLSGKKLLWVDPNPDNNVYGMAVIGESSNSGCDVQACEEPHDALKLLSDGTFDLVISHWGHRPSGSYNQSDTSNAVELLVGIRERGIEVPVIIFASPDAEHAPGNRLKALSLGAFEYTWTFSDLFSSIETIFGRSVIDDIQY